MGRQGRRRCGKHDPAATNAMDLPAESPHRGDCSPGALSMTTDEINLIGYIAAACTTLCWLPQAVRVVRTRDTRAISLWMQGLLCIGIGLWLTYGLLIKSLPVVVSNLVTLPLVLVIVAMKLRHG